MWHPSHDIYVIFTNTEDDGLAKASMCKQQRIMILPHCSNQACFCLYFSTLMSSNAIILQSVYIGENLITLVWGFRKAICFNPILDKYPCHDTPSATVTTTHFSRLILQVHLVRDETDMKGWRCLNSGDSRYYLPHPCPSHRGHFPLLWPCVASQTSGQWRTDTELLSLSAKALCLTPHLAFSGAWA